MNPIPPLRICFVLPGLHRVHRGAESAFESVASELAQSADFAVTLIGSGDFMKEKPYRFLHAGTRAREKFEGWPRVAPLRNECRWEELSFIPALWRAYQPGDFDVSVTCSYPFINWLLRAGRRQKRPRHVFVTQNGDWPPQRRNAEYRFFSCDGLICTNPEYFERHRNTWASRLIPNGFDPEQYRPGPSNRGQFSLPPSAKIVLLVSALIPAKRVLQGLKSVANIPDAFLLLVGDGPQREAFSKLANTLLPNRHLRLMLPPGEMPALYRCADVLLHMGRDEAFGNVYVEALGSGLPIVAHDTSTTRWIFQKPTHGPDSGAGNPSDPTWLVDTADSAAVTRALTEALRCPPREPQRRHALAAARFSWKKIALQYGAFFKETAAR